MLILPGSSSLILQETLLRHTSITQPQPQPQNQSKMSPNRNVLCPGIKSLFACYKQLEKVIFTISKTIKQNKNQKTTFQQIKQSTSIPHIDDLEKSIRKMKNSLERKWAKQMRVKFPRGAMGMDRLSLHFEVSPPTARVECIKLLEENKSSRFGLCWVAISSKINLPS